MKRTKPVLVISVVYGLVGQIVFEDVLLMTFYYLGEVSSKKPISLNQALAGKWVTRIIFKGRPRDERFDGWQGLVKISEYTIDKDGLLLAECFSLLKKY